MSAMDLLADLEARGLIHDSTDRAALSARLSSGPVTLYYGCDPSADSLHIGNLIGLLVLRRFQEAGHRPLALAGGATGMIGDPSGKSEERQLLDPATLAANLAAIKGQLERFLDFSGEGGALLVDNASWTTDLTLLEFLRDVGKHVTVNQMVAKESVRARMESDEGISYTEFTYMLLQAHDFLWLHRKEGCDLQIGGSDQWGNITAGIDLVRRHTGHHVHGLTWPLITRSDGRKFGKSEAGNVWLSAERTSPYAFYQYWMQVADADVRRFLLQLTLLPVAEAEAVAAGHAEAPEQREGQRRLARELTELVHGREEAVAAEAASTILFGGDLDDVPAAALASIEGEVATTTVDLERLTGGLDLVDLLVETGVSSSRSDARRTVDQGGVYINNRQVEGTERQVTTADLQHGRWVLLRRGKKHYHLLTTTA